MLTVAQVAERVNLPRSTIYDQIAKGMLAVYRFGATVRVAEADLDDWISRCREERPKRAPAQCRAEPIDKARAGKKHHIEDGYTGLACIGR